MFKLFKFGEARSATTTASLASRIQTSRSKLLAESGRIRQEMRVTQRESERRKQEVEQLKSNNGAGFDEAVKRWTSVELRSDKLQRTKSFLDRNIDLLDDAALGVRLKGVTALAGDLLGELQMADPKMQQRMEDFEVDYARLTDNVTELLGGINQSHEGESGEFLHKSKILRDSLDD
jgi:hypothetical protein